MTYYYDKQRRTDALLQLAKVLDESDGLDPCRLYKGDGRSDSPHCWNKRCRGFHTCDYDQCVVDVIFDIDEFLNHNNQGALRWW